jgi:formylglycine-generating enzyme required for sulfatase activity
MKRVLDKFLFLSAPVSLIAASVAFIGSPNILAAPPAVQVEQSFSASQAVSSSDMRPSGTLGFTAYLNHLLESHIIGDDELVQLIEAFEKGRVINPIAHLVTPYGIVFTESTYQVHYEGLQGYLDHTALDPQALLLWAESNLKESSRVQERRERARVATLEIFQKMQFNQVQGPQPFEMMSTQVTQKHWSMIMGQNPSKFALGDHTIKLDLQGNSFFLQPDNPVEQVSWYDTQEFIQKLNQLSIQNDPLLFELIVDHRVGDRFQLPKEAQWLTVATNHETAQGTYFIGDKEADLVNYAWYVENSRASTHPVAELRPLIVDGMEFYDILGNVWEWMEDSREEPYYPEIDVGFNLCLEKFNRIKTRTEHVLRGGRWASSANGLSGSHSMTSLPQSRSDGNGFRLVRVRSNGEME